MREQFPRSDAPTVPTDRRSARGAGGRPVGVDHGPARDPGRRTPPRPPQGPVKGDTAKLRISPGIPELPAPTLPLFLPVLGGLWWVVGSTALAAGMGTLVLAAGIGLTAWLALTLRRRHGSGAPLPAGARRQVVRTVAAAAVVGVGGALGLEALSLGELGVPLACAAAGFALFPLARLLDDRALVALGGTLLVVAAVGAVLALGSRGALYPQGLVGMVAGALIWLAAAHRGGLIAELRVRLAR